jgi:hypothetical protein
MSAYSDNRACVIDESLQTHHKPCDNFNSNRDAQEKSRLSKLIEKIAKYDEVLNTGKGTVYIIHYRKDAKDATKTP